MFADAIVGGTLVSLLSFLLEAVNSVESRITMAYIIGVLLTLGSFDHVIVTVLHVLFGMLFGAVVKGQFFRRLLYGSVRHHDWRRSPIQLGEFRE